MKETRVNKILIIILLILIISCTNDGIEIPPNPSCKIVNYGKKVFLPTFNQDGELITPASESFNYELVYNDNKIIKRIDFDINTRIDRDSISYDNLNRVTNIYELDLFSGIFKYVEFLYRDSSKNPYRIDTYNIYKSGKESLTSIENLFYNEDGQLSKIRNSKKSLITDYLYDENKNLVTIIKNDSRYGRKTITTIGGYDNKINPYFGLPFIDLRDVSYSLNNYKDIRSETFLNDVFTGFKRSSIFEYEYNELGYPTNNIEYDCN